MINFFRWLIGLPKCKIGGRCDMKVEYRGGTRFIGKIEGVPSFYTPSKYYCSKCGIETTEYGKI